MESEVRKFCAACMQERQTDLAQCPACGGALTILQSRSLVGEMLDGRYEILERLGKGGMSVVYRARHRYLDREVAVKVLRTDVSDEPKAVARFLQEAKAVSGLKSLHTVKVHDFGVTADGFLYLVMEFLAGQSVRDVLRSAGWLEYRRAVRIAVQVCASLAEAHANQLWHRDIKPDNIFLTRLGDGTEVAKVLDFGIAKWGAAPENVTDVGLICGTPEYLSPEQARGRELDGRTDIYSLGIVLYEMLTGSPPFQADSAVKLMVSHLMEKPLPPGRKNPGAKIPEALGQVVLWTLKKKQHKRPETAEEFARALSPFLRYEDDTEYVATQSFYSKGAARLTPQSATPSSLAREDSEDDILPEVDLEESTGEIPSLADRQPLADTRRGRPVPVAPPVPVPPPTAPPARETWQGVRNSDGRNEGARGPAEPGQKARPSAGAPADQQRGVRADQVEDPAPPPPDDGFSWTPVLPRRGLLMSASLKWWILAAAGVTSVVAAGVLLLHLDDGASAPEPVMPPTGIAPATPVRPPTVSEAPVRTPTVSEAPVRAPTVREGPIRTPTVSEAPVRAPTVREGPVRTPTVREGPVAEPAALLPLPENPAAQLPAPPPPEPQTPAPKLNMVALTGDHPAGLRQPSAGVLDVPASTPALPASTASLSGRRLPVQSTMFDCRSSRSCLAVTPEGKKDRGKSATASAPEVPFEEVRPGTVPAPPVEATATSADGRQTTTAKPAPRTAPGVEDVDRAGTDGEYGSVNPAGGDSGVGSKAPDKGGDEYSRIPGP